MKTKIIPFNLETAKKIQAGEIEGKIKTRCGHDARILCTDLMGQAQPILAAFITCRSESVSQYTKGGRFYISGGLHDFDLVLEVPDNEPQFKSFDKVLVRDSDINIWIPRLYSHKGNIGYRTQDGCEYMQILPYEGNEYLVGTTDKPKELC